MKRQFFTLFLASITLAASFQLGSGGLSHASDPTQGAAVTAALKDDIAKYSESSGLSAEEIEHYVSGQDTFAVQVNQFQLDHPDVFVDAVWDGPNSERSAIYVNSPRVSCSGCRTVYVDAMSAVQRDRLEGEIIDRLVSSQKFESLSVNIDPLSAQIQLSYSGSVDENQMRQVALEVSAEKLKTFNATDARLRSNQDPITISKSTETAGLQS